MPFSKHKKVKYRNILVPDGESHLLILIVQCLRRNQANRIFALSSVRRKPAKYSRHVYRYSYYPYAGDDSTWIHQINEEVRKHDIDVILPIYETGIRRILANRDKLEKPEKLCLLPELSSFDIAGDKWRLYLHLRKYDLPSPKTELIDGAADIKNLAYPGMVKPTSGIGGGNQVQLLHNELEFVHYFKDKSANGQAYIFQEPVKGRDFCCNVLCREGHTLAYTIQRSEMQVRVGFGPQMAYRFVENESIRELVFRLMKTLNWSGVACVDLRYDEQNKEYKILEVNTRFWRSVVGSCYAGINFPDLIVTLAAEGTANTPSGYEILRFYDLMGILTKLSRRPWLALDIGLMLKNTPLKEAFLDPLPYLYKFFSLKANLLIQYFNKKMGRY